MRAVAEFPAGLLLSALTAFIFSSLYLLAVNRRIRWERQRGLYAKENHVFYWAVHGYLCSLWKNAASRFILVFLCAALIFAAARISRGRLSRHPGRGIYPSFPLDAAPQYPSADTQSWLLGLEKFRNKQGPAAYCRKIQLEMAQLSGLKEHDTAQKVKMRFLSQNWTKHCETRPAGTA